ncbi:hypothetical protein SLEP1_g57736 [Rubroshorea leprosula]|uniref:non-specific serine/threonine protein kinase n=1 Tax=Rubroshorea leprosula TaxID=152421 RepID=A0AAV5MND9_9ROSI|nr:hypothetical protein SLEP1_g57736 [Rubroshorea leprosula]
MPLQNFFKFLKKTTVKERGRKPSALSEGLCRQFSLAELKAATNNFHHDLKLGQGGYGVVYKGLIDGGSLVVAVKRFSGSKHCRPEGELLCQLRHQNIVSLLGFCHEEREMILVFEYVTRGSLDRHLFGNADPLPWKRRLEISIAAARGLHYLHTAAKHVIIHRDVKPSNILLDENWDAKLSDFGTSKIGPLSISKPKPNALTKTKSGIKGTIGYIAPEYLMLSEFSEKLDITGQGVERFQNEEQLLCQLRHQNLVSLLGFCHEKDERILVYEHMTHRGLSDHLFGNADPPPWKRRLEICIGAARGLHYIHTGAKYAIIHHDPNCSNILLDENWEAKLSDFALSKIGSLSISKPKPNA